MLEKNALFSPYFKPHVFFMLNLFSFDLKRYGCTNLSFTILFEFKKKPSHTLKDLKLETFTMPN